MTGRNGEAACEGMLAELRKKHTVKSSQPLPARSTVGIVLEGTVKETKVQSQTQNPKPQTNTKPKPQNPQTLNPKYQKP